MTQAKNSNTEEQKFLLYQQRPHEKWNGSACLQHHTLKKEHFVIGHDHSTSIKRVMHWSGKKINRWPWKLWNKMKERRRTYDNRRNNTDMQRRRQVVHRLVFCRLNNNVTVRLHIRNRILCLKVHATPACASDRSVTNVKWLWSIVGMIQKGERKVLEENLYQCHFAHSKSHDRHGIEPRFPWWEEKPYSPHV